MRVLQVNKFYYPEIGGIERVVQNIAEGLPDPYSTRVLAARPKGFGGAERHNGVDVVKTSSLGTTLSVPLSPTFPIRLRTMAQDADIVHHHLPNPLSTVSHLAAGAGDAPVVATYHSDIVRQKKAFRIYRPVIEQFLDSVDRIIVTSDRLLDHSKMLEPFTEKCDVVPLSINLNAIKDEDPSPLDIETQGMNVLFVGRLNYYKGVEYLIDAITDVPANLIVVGDGEQRTALEQRSRKRGVADRVQFLGRVSDERLASAYHTADLFVLPSVEPSEAFGVVQLEAMARGLPVVNTSLPTGVPWVSLHRETGLTVEPRDSDVLADAITKLIEDDKRRQKYGKQARERVEQLFTREQMLEQIQTIYRRVVEESKT